MIPGSTRAATNEMRQSLASGTQQTEQLDQVIVRFAGDSGDGMQLTGDRFTTSSAHFGNDMATFPDFRRNPGPGGHAERRLGLPGAHLRPRHPDPGRRPQRPGGHEPGGSQGQPRADGQGDHTSWSTAMPSRSGTSPRPATPGPLSDGSLGAYTVYEVPMTSITQEVCKEAGVKPRDAERSKNFFALGLVSWLYTRPIDPTLEWITERFGSKPQVAEACRHCQRFWPHARRPRIVVDVRDPQ